MNMTHTETYIRSYTWVSYKGGKIMEHRRYDELRELRKKDDEITGIRKTGISGLTLPGNNSAMRDVMFNAHQKQCLTLYDAEIPNMFTGGEKVVAKISGSQVVAENNYRIYRKIL